MQALEQSERSGGGVLNNVSNELVHLYKEQFGRGPTKVRSHFAGPDTLICLLEDSMTPVERNMAVMGEHQRLRDMRLFFQHATVDQFTEVVERLTGRKVRAFVSGMDTQEDVSAEIFVFLPVDVDGDGDGNRDGDGNGNGNGNGT